MVPPADQAKIESQEDDLGRQTTEMEVPHWTAGLAIEELRQPAPILDLQQNFQIRPPQMVQHQNRFVARFAELVALELGHCLVGLTDLVALGPERLAGQAAAVQLAIAQVALDQLAIALGLLDQLVVSEHFDHRILDSTSVAPADFVHLALDSMSAVDSQVAQ